MYYFGRGVLKDDFEAYKWYRKAALGGNGLAQMSVGNRAKEFEDYTGAVKWYRMAAEQGRADGQYNLGDMYREGYGVPADYAEAVKWYRKAAEQGNATGQYNLGIMYYKGWGVPQNHVEAYKWYNLAATGGEKYVRKYRNSVAKKMTPAQITEAQKLAREWWAAFKKRKGK